MNPVQIKYYILLLLMTILCHFSISAQVVYSVPQFPTQTDTITLFYDATQGNAALQNYEGEIYANTGIISNFSNLPNDWQHVISEWGTADQRTLMKKENNNLYSLTFHIENFYQLSDREIIEQLAFVICKDVKCTILSKFMVLSFIIEQMIKDQNYQPIEKEAFYKKAKELNITKSLEDLLVP